LRRGRFRSGGFGRRLFELALRNGSFPGGLRFGVGLSGCPLPRRFRGGLRLGSFPGFLGRRLGFGLAAPEFLDT
jgi:hypothetical protein